MSGFPFWSPGPINPSTFRTMQRSKPSWLTIWPVMKHLCDITVFLALSLRNHPHHARAVEWMESLAGPDRACFCRATQQSWLRLLTTAATVQGEVRSNDEAIEAWRIMTGDPRVSLVAAEPPGLDRQWLALAGHRSPAPKRWMDAYLAAFALCGRMRLVTFDRGFTGFLDAGLDLLLLRSDRPQP